MLINSFSLQGLPFVFRCSRRVSGESFRSAHTQFPFLGSQCVKLAQSLLTSLLVKGIECIVGLVKVGLFLLQLSTILEHGGHLLRVEEAVRLTGSKRPRGTKCERILTANV